MAADPFSTARAMFLVAFGCPPLPILAKHQETGTTIVASTHDLLSTFLITTFRRQDQRENQRRRVLQSQLEEVYYSKLTRCSDFEEAYQLMVDYTRGYLSTYIDPDGPLSPGDFQILAVDHVTPSILHEIGSYLNGMRILINHETEDEKSLAQQSVRSLLMACIRCAVNQKKQRVLEGEGVQEQEEEVESGVTVF
jgi:hypothetical protein